MQKARSFPQIVSVFLSGALMLVGVVVATSAPGGAATTPGGAYASLTTPAGANPSWTSAVTIPGANGFPSSSLATTSLSPSVPSGSSAWLSASTPFGGQFGSSQGLSYLSFGATTSQANSTTVLTFASPTPTAGWGFALGDVDAESIQLSATDASGNAIAVSGLGYQGNFNYCAVSPKPSTCTGAGPFTDVPTWNAGTATLAGNGADTSGASGWFMRFRPHPRFLFRAQRPFLFLTLSLPSAIRQEQKLPRQAPMPMAPFLSLPLPLGSIP